MRRLLLTLVLLSACGGDDGGGGGGTVATGMDSVTEGDECIPGEERCECNQGQCLTGLVCASNVCVQLPNDPGDPPPGADSSGGSDGGSDDGPIPCGSTSECFYTDVCVDGTCVDAWTQSYEMRVVEFMGCPVDGSGGAEVYFEVYQEGNDPELLYRSAISGCPAGWGNEPFELSVFDGAFQIDFWEEDAFTDDFVTSVCWDTLGDGLCGPFPKSFGCGSSWVVASPAISIT